MLAIIPYQADVPMHRWPFTNFAAIALITLTSVALMVGGDPMAIRAFALDGWSPTGLLGHLFAHGGLIHLFGNMLFLWVFGNAVCAKVGNLAYPFLFLLFGLFGGVLHILFDGAPAIGASGAINGVVGMFLFYYPQNEIRFLWFFFLRGGSFALSSIWLILFWLVFDIWGAVSGSAGVAYWAHIGGFAAGAGIAAASLHFDWVEMTRTERSLLDVWAGRS
jgi:membrane associated rhomboid family serine protease